MQHFTSKGQYLHSECTARDRELVAAGSPASSRTQKGIRKRGTVRGKILNNEEKLHTGEELNTEEKLNTKQKLNTEA
jgi:ribosomal protein S6E (S10)